MGREFESLRGHNSFVKLANDWGVSSAGLEHYLDRVGVIGSNPIHPTLKKIRYNDRSFSPVRSPDAIGAKAGVRIQYIPRKKRIRYSDRSFLWRASRQGSLQITAALTNCHDL